VDEWMSGWVDEEKKGRRKCGVGNDGCND